MNERKKTYNNTRVYKHNKCFFNHLLPLSEGGDLLKLLTDHYLLFHINKTRQRSNSLPSTDTNKSTNTRHTYLHYNSVENRIKVTDRIPPIKTMGQ